MKTLHVWYKEKLVGILQKKSHPSKPFFIFQYSTSWLQDTNSFDISFSLPRQEGAFPSTLSYAFFDNLLPEESIRKKIALQKNIHHAHTFELLEAIGAECAGALSILKIDELPTTQQIPKLISLENLSQYITQQADFYSDVEQSHGEVRLSIAGAQAKFSIVLSGSEIYKPTIGVPSTHILKVPSATYPYIVENELFCMGLAYHLGLKVPEFYATATVPSAYIVQRYDRKVESIPYGITKLHQEDFCQALGIESKDKYQRSSSKVNLEKCFTILNHVENPIEDRKRLVQWIIFNVLIGNSDAHAKNISLLYTEGQKPSLAPFYDLVSTAPYPIDQTLALKIGGKNVVEFIILSKWRKLQQISSISNEDFKHIALSLVTSMQDSIEGLRGAFIEQYGMFDGLRIIEDTIKARCARFYPIFSEL